MLLETPIVLMVIVSFRLTAHAGAPFMVPLEESPELLASPGVVIVALPVDVVMAVSPFRVRLALQCWVSLLFSFPSFVVLVLVSPLALDGGMPSRHREPCFADRLQHPMILVMDVGDRSVRQNYLGWPPVLILVGH